jgi:acyl-CoA reductase-like NAD-dependent aldehyde dehydrogenase
MEEISKITLEPEIVQETETKKTITRYTPMCVCVGIVPWSCRSKFYTQTYKDG